MRKSKANGVIEVPCGWHVVDYPGQMLTAVQGKIEAKHLPASPSGRPQLPAVPLRILITILLLILLLMRSPVVANTTKGHGLWTPFGQPASLF